MSYRNPSVRPDYTIDVGNLIRNFVTGEEGRILQWDLDDAKHAILRGSDSSVWERELRVMVEVIVIVKHPRYPQMPDLQVWNLDDVVRSA